MMGDSPLTSPRFIDLLERPPGDGVTVRQQNAGRQIEFRAQMSTAQSLMRVLAGAFAFPLMIFSAAILLHAFDAASTSWIWIGVGITLFALAVAHFTMAGWVLMTKLTRLRLVLTDSSLEITARRDGGIRIPRTDVRSIVLLRANAPDWTLHARLTDPWEKSDARGIGIVTDAGTIEVFKTWHDSVTVWGGRLIAAWANVDIRGTAPEEREIATSGNIERIPAKVDRKSWSQIGICAMLLGSFLAYLAWPSVRDSFAAADWQKTIGIVEKVETIDPRRGADYMKVTYSYSVGDQQYTNDRFSITTGYSFERDESIRKLPLQGAVDVWFDPRDPQRAAIDRSFATPEVILFGVCVAIALAGGWSLIYAATAYNSPVEERYGAEPMRPRSRT